MDLFFQNCKHPKIVKNGPIFYPKKSLKMGTFFCQMTLKCRGFMAQQHTQSKTKSKNPPPSLGSYQLSAQRLVWFIGYVLLISFYC